MPQLDSATYASQLFWLVVTFAVLYFVMARQALPRISEVLEERQTRIASDLAKAEQLKLQAEGAMAAYEASLVSAREQAQALMVTAREDSAKAGAAQAAAHNAATAARIAEAEARIQAALRDAMGHIRAVAAEAAEAATERLIGAAVGSEAAGRAVGRELEAIET